MNPDEIENQEVEFDAPVAVLDAEDDGMESAPEEWPLPAGENVAELSDEEFENSVKPLESAEPVEIAEPVATPEPEKSKGKSKSAKPSNSVAGTPAPLDAPPAPPKEELFPMPSKPFENPKKAQGEKIVAQMNKATSDALVMLPVLESNLDISHGLVSAMANWETPALVSAYKAAECMDTAAWVVKAGVAYNLRQKVKAEVSKRDKSGDATKVARRIDEEMDKIARVQLGSEAKTLRDYSRIYGNFFANSPGSDLSGEVVTVDRVIEACRAGLTWSHFVEADRAPNRGAALILFQDLILSGKLSVRDARAKVDQMRADAGVAGASTEGKDGEEGKSAKPAKARPIGAIDRPLGPIPGVGAEFINALIRASNDVGRDTNPDAEIFVYIDGAGDVIASKTLPAVEEPTEGLEAENIGLLPCICVSKRNFTLDTMIFKLSS